MEIKCQLDATEVFIADRQTDRQTDRPTGKDAQTDMTMVISLFALLRGLKKCAGFFRTVIRFTRNAISRKALEIIHVAECIEKRMLNRRTHLWRIDNARLPSIVPARVKQKEMLEETLKRESHKLSQNIMVA